MNKSAKKITSDTNSGMPGMASPLVRESEERSRSGAGSTAFCLSVPIVEKLKKSAEKNLLPADSRSRRWPNVEKLKVGAEKISFRPQQGIIENERRKNLLPSDSRSRRWLTVEKLKVGAEKIFSRPQHGIIENERRKISALPDREKLIISAEKSYWPRHGKNQISAPKKRLKPVCPIAYPFMRQ